MDNYARLAGKLAADFRCNAVVGHSLAASISIATLAPHQQRARASALCGDVEGDWPAMKSSLPPDRSDALIADMKRNDPRFLQRQTRRYFE
jgi:hypothetical protein